MFSFVVFLSLMFWNRHESIEYKHAQSAQRRLIKTETMERLIARLEVEQQGYRHILNTIVS